MNKLRFYLFAVRWLWRNRSWEGTRQKYKALERGWLAHERARTQQQERRPYGKNKS